MGSLCFHVDAANSCFVCFDGLLLLKLVNSFSGEFMDGTASKQTPTRKRGSHFAVNKTAGLLPAVVKEAHFDSVAFAS